MDVAALIISILALLVASASAWFYRQQAQGALAQASEAKRANDRLDAMDAAESEAARIEAERNRVRWDLKLVGKNQWTLRNVGLEAAQNVELSAKSAALRVAGHDGEEPFVIGEMKPQRPVSLMIVPTLSWGDVGPAQLTIAYEGPDEPLVVDIPKT